MFLILLKIIFWVLVIRHTIKWVSYHIKHHNKKARVFHGNYRMPFDVEFALKYGINAKRKTRFKGKDLSYRKTLLQWKLLLNEIYPDDSLYFTRRLQLNLVTPNSINAVTLQTHTDLKSPAYTPMKSEGDLFAKKANPSCGRGVTAGNNRFTQIKKIHNLFTAKPCAKNNGVVSSLLFNTKIVSINNLKIPQNPVPFSN